MGNKRGVTTSEQIDYRPPPANVLEKGQGRQRPRPARPGSDRPQAGRDPRPFGVEAKIVGIVSGPHVSRYELRLAPGTKVKKVTELSNDLAYALASTDIRILAPIPGKQAVGVEVPNTRRRMVRLGDIYAGRPEKTSPLVAWLGKGIDGNAVWTDLAKMPHVLVAGITRCRPSGLRQRETCGPLTRPTIFASTPKWPRVSTSLRPTASWSRGSGPLSFLLPRVSTFAAGGR